MTETAADLSDQKRQIRREALSRRNSLPDKDTLSRRIMERLVSLPEYQSANRVLFYVDVRSEVRTRWFFPEILKTGKTLAVPYCAGVELELFRLLDPSELGLGRFGILEPEQKFRNLPDRQVLPDELDLLIVPGVAFDRSGGRLGHGFGFYDRLLKRVRANVPKIALTFECQIVPVVPMASHDVPLNKIVTENAVYSSRISSR